MKILIILLWSLGAAWGATLTTNGTSTDVQSKLNAAAAGDTIVIPAGTFNWSAGVSRTDVPANVTIQGAGTSATGGGDQTIIVDNYNVDAKLLHFGIASTGVFRMTGITVRSGAATIAKDGGTVNFSGPGTVRIDHCHFVATSGANYRIVNIGSGVFGVLDHCIVDLIGTNAIYVQNGRFGGGGDYQGNYEWSLPTNFPMSRKSMLYNCLVLS